MNIFKIHTYIYICTSFLDGLTNMHALQLFSQDHNLTSHSTYVVLTSNDKFFEKLFIYSQSFGQISMRGSRRQKYFSYFISLETFNPGFKSSWPHV